MPVVELKRTRESHYANYTKLPVTAELAQKEIRDLAQQDDVMAFEQRGDSLGCRLEVPSLW